MQVHVTFKDTAKAEPDLVCTIEIQQDGSDSVWDVKTRIAVRVHATAAHFVTSAHLQHLRPTDDSYSHHRKHSVAN